MRRAWRRPMGCGARSTKRCRRWRASTPTGSLRRLAALIRAITRTNYYQAGADGGPKPYISFKVASRELADLPAPKPFREIFVASPNVEGVHLRLGPVARGGIRWSDRRDDFRTEVLGLVKAQQVKNAVIVPVGSKGGFYPKQLPKGGSADAVRAEAVRRLHDLPARPPGPHRQPRRRRRGGPPGRRGRRTTARTPYLVVAADKGTATLFRHRQCAGRRLRLLAGRRLRLRRLGRLRPQGHGHHRPRRLGGDQAPLPRAGQGHPDRARSPWSASATCRATCSATACCCRASSG